MTTEWTKESMAQAIAEEGLDFVVRELNSHEQLLEALIAARGMLTPKQQRTWPNNYERICAAIKAAEEA